MTIQCLSEDEQRQAALMFVHGTDIKDLAASYNCSSRTMQRILKEQGVWPNRPRAGKSTRTVTAEEIVMPYLKSLTFRQLLSCVWRCLIEKQ